jgi:hypothetical protein
MSDLQGPQPLSALIPELIAYRGYGQNLAREEREEAWQAILCGEFPDRTSCGRFSRGVLEILVQDSIIVQELSMRKTELLRELQQRLNRQHVQELRFRINSAGQ